MMPFPDSLRKLLRKALDERGGITKNLQYFRKKRAAVYFWLNGKTKSIDDYLFLDLMQFVDPYMTTEDHIELDPLRDIARRNIILSSPIVTEKKDQILSIISEVWNQLTEQDKADVLVLVTSKVKFNARIRKEASEAEAEADYKQEQYEIHHKIYHK